MGAAVAVGCVLITAAALILTALLFCPPLAARALRLPCAPKLVRVTNGRQQHTYGGGTASPPSPGWLGWPLLDPAHPVARAWSASPRRPSRAVLAWRVGGVLLAAASLVVNGTTDGGFGDEGWWAVFFTNWTFVLMLAATLAGGWVSGRAVWGDRRKRGKEAPAGTTAAAAAQAKPAPPPAIDAATPAPAWRADQRAHVLLMAVLAPTALFITIFYWAALFPADSRARGGAPPHPDAVMKHGVNAAWALGDTVLSRTPSATPHFPILAAWAGLYLVFLFLYAGAKGVWVYGVFDWGRHGVATLGVYAALPALLGLCAVVVYGVAAGREAVRRRWWSGGEGGGGAAETAAASAAVEGGGAGAAAAAAAV